MKPFKPSGFLAEVLTVTIAVVLFFTGCREYEPSAGSSEKGRFRLKAWDTHQAMQNVSSFREKEWIFFGPSWMSGRISDVAVPGGTDSTIYASTASGGVWKSYDRGRSWKPILDEAPSTSMGDLAIAPSDTNIVWIGTGEPNIFRSGKAGIGVYKSINGGKSWKHMGLDGTFTIGRILVHPSNPDIVYVAASGHGYTYNKERGVYKTTDGGKTWEKILYISEKVGAIDLVMDPEDPETLYASMWNRIRDRWSDPYPGPNDGLFKTTDGGQKWRKITEGLPEDSLRGRIGIDVARSNPNVLYAFVDNHHTDTTAELGTDTYGRKQERQVLGAEVYKSSDKGETWERMNQTTGLIDSRMGLTNTYGWVFGQIRVDPTDENTIYVLGVPLVRSTDGGKTYERLSYEGLHADQHALWIDPENPDYLVSGNDGGVNVSNDGGETWYNNKTLPVVQFFNIHYDMEDPFRLYGSVQDNGTFRGPIDHDPAVDSSSEWERIPGGEATYITMDKKNPNILFTSSFYGRLRKSEYIDGEWETEKILTQAKEGEPELRGRWLAPTVFSEHDDSVLYHCFQFVFKTTDFGKTWEKISPDLTNFDSSRQGDYPYKVNFSTITTLDESPLKQGLLYAGTDDGNIQVTRKDGEAWKNVIGDLPKDKHVSRICASQHNESTVYLTLNGKREDDFQAYVYRSDDYGKTWETISSNIPMGPVNVIIEDPRDENVLYVGTDIGVYISTNRGDSWEVLGHGLPSTYVNDLKLHPRDLILVAATHGRSLFKMDVSDIVE